MLLLINGAPGVGKSTLAHRYADEHPLALIIDIDSIRTHLGQWARFDTSKLVARDLALALARAHLRNGHDVVVPQYLGRPEYRERLELLAGESDVPFVEVLLADDTDRITQRFRMRRAEYASAGAAHPEGDLDDEAVGNEVSAASDGLLRDAIARGVPVISAAGGTDESYLALCERLASAHRPAPGRHANHAQDRGRDLMKNYPLGELREAFEQFSRVSDECAASGDYNAFADLFTDDCTYIEHVFGEMHGREAVRQWIVPLMKQQPNDQMTYTHDWVLFDEPNGRVVFCARTHMPDPGDGTQYSTTNWSMIDYAGDGRWSREEDVYNPANFGTMLGNWQAAKDAAAKS